MKRKGSLTFLYPHFLPGQMGITAVLTSQAVVRLHEVHKEFSLSVWHRRSQQARRAMMIRATRPSARAASPQRADMGAPLRAEKT